MEQTARALIERHEGVKLKPYVDTVGKVTVGVGRNLTDVGISMNEAMMLLDNDITIAQRKCEQYPWFSALSPARKAAILDLVFNMGSLNGWPNFLAAASRQDWSAAAKELESSRWYAQVKSRGPEIVNLILTETWPA